MGSPDPSSVSDLNASVQAIRELRVVPIDGAAVVQLVVAAGIPLLAVVATQVPVAELAKWILDGSSARFCKQARVWLCVHPRSSARVSR